MAYQHTALVYSVMLGVALVAHRYQRPELAGSRLRVLAVKPSRELPNALLKVKRPVACRAPTNNFQRIECQWRVGRRFGRGARFVEQGKAVLGLDFGIVQGAGGASTKPATGSTGSPSTLPTTGGEQTDTGLDVWPFLSVWFIVCGAAFIALTALAPRTRRK